VINRALVVLVLSMGLVLAGLPSAASGEPPIPPTVSEHLDGLPLGEDPGTFQQRLRAYREGSGGGDGAPEPSRADEVAGAAAVRSAAVRTPIPFSMVGFAIPPGAEVSFRTSADGREWTPWQWAPAVGNDGGPDPGTAEAQAAAPPETRSEGHWVGRATSLQVRVLNGRPEDVGVDLIDSLGLSRSLPERAADAVRAAVRPAPEPAIAAPGRPRIVSREEWGADESLRKDKPTYASRVRMGVVHHTAGANDYTAAEAPGVMRAVYRYHTVNQGWSDVGYNLLIDRFGTVYEGRAGGLESAVVGAHSRNWNTGSFGVSVIGCFDSQACAGVPGGGGSLPAAAEEALIDVLAWKLDVHSVDVDATITMNNTKVRTLVGHRDIGATSCPGNLLYAKLDAIRERVAARQADQGGVVVDPGATPSVVALREGKLGDEVTLSARLRPPGAWQLEVTDVDGRLVHNASGSGDTAVSRWSGGSGLRPGTYRYAFSSPGRRTATGAFAVEALCGDAFCDIVGSVHREAILRLHERDVVHGCAEGRFCPSGRVTRGQMATMTARALQLTPAGDGHFRDVPAGHPHAAGINALYERGIVQGDGGRFFPDRLVRRDQMATFLRNGLGLTPSGASHFSDVAGNTHEAAINALGDHDIARGDGARRFLPDRPIRRDQIASLLDRALQVAP